MSERICRLSRVAARGPVVIRGDSEFTMEFDDGGDSLRHRLKAMPPPSRREALSLPRVAAHSLKWGAAPAP